MMVAATALFASCNPDNGEGTGTGNNGGGNTEKPFYGFTVDGADVSAIGGDDYIFQMYILDEAGSVMRLMSAHVTVPGVVDDVIPEGTYKLKEGEIGDTGMYFKGSYYENASADSGYYMLVTDGELELKHTAKGYRATVSADGINAEDGSAIKDIECRYEGDLEIVGNALPYVEDTAYAVYLGADENGANWWVFEYDVNESYYVDFYLLTNTSFEEGIPSGKYPFAMTGAAGTAVPSYSTSQGYSGSMLVFWDAEAESGYIADLFLGGEVNVVKNDDGTYSLDAIYYSYYNIPSVASYEGEVYFYDQTASEGGDEEGYELNIDVAQFVYAGGGTWLAYLVDAANDAMCVLDVYCDEENTFEDGLPAGTYTVADTYAPFTIGAGALDASYNYDGGSCVTDAAFTKLYDVILGGEMVVGENYATEVAFEGMMYNWSGSFAGEAMVVDGTAVAPAKAAAKLQVKSTPKFSKETKEVAFKRNIAR